LTPDTPSSSSVLTRIQQVRGVVASPTTLSSPQRRGRRAAGAGHGPAQRDQGPHQTTNQLRALLVDGGDELRGRLGPLRKHRLAHACADLNANGGALQLALRSLGHRWLALHQEITDFDQAITTTMTRIALRPLARHSVGAHTAARLLPTAGVNPTRLRSEAAFAVLCGTSPLEASSGKTVRHRLNRGGDRAANNALWTIAFVRLIQAVRIRLNECLTAR
jgi:transposase